MPSESNRLFVPRRVVLHQGPRRAGGIENANRAAGRDDTLAEAEKLGLGVDAVRRALSLKRGEIQLNADELNNSTVSFMQAVHEAAEFSDRLEMQAR